MGTEDMLRVVGVSERHGQKVNKLNSIYNCCDCRIVGDFAKLYLSTNKRNSFK